MKDTYHFRIQGITPLATESSKAIHAVAFKQAVMNLCGRTNRMMIAALVNESVFINGDADGMVIINGTGKEWTADLSVVIFDNRLDPKWFCTALNVSGFFCGVGRNRPEVNGIRGQFKCLGYEKEVA